MKVTGIIAEYNPFHNGHLYHLKKSKELTGADTTVAVMSGDFVQRGEPAVTNKWIRSEMAVRNGIDLVLELPFAYACNNAEIFATGGIRLLEGLGIIDSICFGSESGDIERLSEVASILSDETPEFSKIIKEKMNEGMSYPKARQESLAETSNIDMASLLGSPNNILSIEYLKQLKLQDSKIKPYTITRFGAGLEEADNNTMIAGATAIRNMLDGGKIADALDYLTDASKSMFETQGMLPVDYEVFKELVTYSIITKSEHELSDIYSVTEGLENKIKAAAKQSLSLKNMVEHIKSKRYTQTRIKRVLVHILVNLTRTYMNRILEENQMYARVLAFNDQGASLLKTIKKSECSKIPVVTNISKESDELQDCRVLFEYDILASDIYNLATIGEIHKNSDYRQVPAFVR